MPYINSVAIEHHIHIFKTYISLKRHLYHKLLTIMEVMYLLAITKGLISPYPNFFHHPDLRAFTLSNHLLQDMIVM